MIRCSDLFQYQLEFLVNCFQLLLLVKKQLNQKTLIQCIQLFFSKFHRHNRCSRSTPGNHSLSYLSTGKVKNNFLFCTILCHEFRFHRSDGFLRNDSQSFRQSSELLWRMFSDFISDTRPLEMTIRQSFIKKAAFTFSTYPNSSNDVDSVT